MRSHSCFLYQITQKSVLEIQLAPTNYNSFSKQMKSSWVYWEKCSVQKPIHKRKGDLFLTGTSPDIIQSHRTIRAPRCPRNKRGDPPGTPVGRVGNEANVMIDGCLFPLIPGSTRWFIPVEISGFNIWSYTLRSCFADMRYLSWHLLNPSQICFHPNTPTLEISAYNRGTAPKWHDELIGNEE